MCSVYLLLSPIPAGGCLHSPLACSLWGCEEHMAPVSQGQHVHLDPFLFRKWLSVPFPESKEINRIVPVVFSKCAIGHEDNRLCLS